MLEKFKDTFRPKAIEKKLESKEKRPELIKEIPLQEGKRFTVEKENGKVRVLLKEEEKVIGNFNKLLPEGFQYQIGDAWHVDWEKKGVIIGDWKDSRDILSLLHEVGHTRDPEECTKLLEYEIKYLQLIEESRRSKERTTEVSNLFLRKKRDIIQGERNAWAWALRAARHISRNKGVDLLQGFRNVKEIKNWVDRSLETYRKYCLIEFKDLFPKGVYTEKEIKRFLEKKQHN